MRKISGRILILSLFAMAMAGCVSRATYRHDIEVLQQFRENHFKWIRDHEDRISRLERIIWEEGREREQRSMGSNRPVPIPGNVHGEDYDDIADEVAKDTDRHFWKEEKELLKVPKNIWPQKSRE